MKWSSFMFASCLALAVPAGGRQAVAIDYDTFMRSDEQKRIELFNAIGPENQADLVRTHVTRWLAANRHRLSSEQIEIMEDNLAFVTPDIYKRDRSSEVIVRQKELERRTAAIFTTKDMRQALTIHGDYIPPRQRD